MLNFGFDIGLLEIFFLSLLLGSFIGFLAGVFGIGGGTIGVPAYLLLFSEFAEITKIPESVIMLEVLATMLAMIFFASLVAMRQHKKFGNYRADISEALRYGFFAGGFIGSYIANKLSNDVLILLVAIFLYANSAKIFFQKNTQNEQNEQNEQNGNNKNTNKTANEIVATNPNERLLAKKILVIFGLVTGILSAIIGVGGAIFIIPLLIYCKVHIRQIVATTSSVAVYLALGGSLGYFLMSFTLPENIVIPYSIGFVYLPALLGSLIGSCICIKYGVKTAQKISANTLTKLLAILLFALATAMLMKTNLF